METRALQMLLPEQRAAAEPGANVWLGASAGTGKTQVLTARVLRLLLQGVSPGSILCITFTQAGAAEMARRVRDRLAYWVQADDGALRVDLHAIGADPDAEGALAMARTLFAHVIDGSGGDLRIQTIHSFCQSLLGSFPIEAEVIPGFSVAEDTQIARLIQEVLSTELEAMEGEGDAGRALLETAGALGQRMGKDAAVAFLKRCAEAGDSWRILPDPAHDWLRARLGIPAGTVGEAEAVLMAEQDIANELSVLSHARQHWNTDTAGKIADAARHVAASWPNTPRDDLIALRKLLITAKGEPPAHFHAGKQLSALAEEASAVLVAMDKVLAVEPLITTATELADAWQLGRRVASAYVGAKQTRAMADFGDLIALTARMLHEGVMSDWIRYKLDQRIDHMLIDEAQDTNALQWQVIGGLTEEFFAGHGAKDDRVRTVFTVGDVKQAIFGFQGTSPLAFRDAERRYEPLARAIDNPLQTIALNENFRSVPAVLEVVNRWLERTPPETLGLNAAVPMHETRITRPGSVELWRKLAPIEVESNPDADTSDGDVMDDPSWRLAQGIAERVRHWIDHGLDGERVEPGDIMILVRTRRNLMRGLVGRLQALNVPVAGIDSFSLTQPLAVLDLLSSARFTQQPLDDLNLAGLMVSPLVGFDHDELMRIAAPRKPTMRLWDVVRTYDDPRVETLHTLLRIADFAPPFEFFETVLSGPLQGRRKLFARLGTEARDPIDELLTIALEFSERETPSMAAFLQWVDESDVVIKRRSDASNVVRVNTVHGAKGLQAPIVILADATTTKMDRARPFGLSLDPEGSDADLPVFSLAKPLRVGALGDIAAASAARDNEEYWRLLYVALTRPERRLIVTGTMGTRPGPDSWYDAVEKTLMSLGADWEAGPEPWGTRLVHASGSKSKGKATPRAKAPDAPPMPAWVAAPPPEEAQPPRPLTPTAPDDDTSPLPPPTDRQRKLARRGTLMHGLFERLPAVPRERRDVAMRWLEQQGAEFDPAERQAMLDAVRAIIDDPAYTDLFSPDALGEAPVAAVAGAEVISGVVDRLRVTNDAVTFVDFKTGSFVPETAANVPAEHMRQMAAYHTALSTIFSGRRVTGALLYTSGPRLLVVTGGDGNHAPADGS